MTRKICKTCKLFVKEDVCPVCKRNQFTTNFKGRIIIMNPEKSEIAKKIGAEIAGEYAIKIR